jgi:hypothetical protein
MSHFYLNSMLNEIEQNSKQNIGIVLDDYLKDSNYLINNELRFKCNLIKAISDQMGLSTMIIDDVNRYKRDAKIIKHDIDNLIINLQNKLVDAKTIIDNQIEFLNYDINLGQTQIEKKTKETYDQQFCQFLEKAINKVDPS